MNTDAMRALAAVDRQRAELTARVQLPAWYLALFGLGWTAAFAQDPLLRIYHLYLLGDACFLLGLAVLLSYPFAHRVLRGVRLPTRKFRAYPSIGRSLWYGPTVLLVLALVVEFGCETAGEGTIAVVSACVVGPLAVLLLHRVLTAMAADIRHGRVIGL